MAKEKTKIKALLLMSGGLDSILAAKLLQNQGISVTPICFKSFFFGCDQAQKACKQLGLKLMEIDFSKKYLTMLRSPKYGMGSAMNPCIDCHLLMLKEAKKIMKAGEYDFVATGEVLGERPMSQNPRALNIIEKEAGLKGYLLRPLSAKIMEETIPEKKGLVNREKLEAINGRSRKPQLELVKKFGIKEFPTPGGGCILTDKNYSENLKKILEFKKNPNENDFLIIRQGRVFWKNNILIVVARDKSESKMLKKIHQIKDVYLEPKNFSGPSVIIRAFGKANKKELIIFGREYLLKFSKNIPNNPKISE
ncbi:MAG: tRNA 4-thiouridine(8) synthase ThiI [Candidatus Paceibacterota bacterium]